MLECPVSIAAAITYRVLLHSEMHDVYTCGVLLWELIAGKPVSEIGGVLPADLRADCPAVIDDIVDRATRQEEWQRYATPEEMADVLARSVPLASPDEVSDWFARVLSLRPAADLPTLVPMAS